MEISHVEARPRSDIIVRLNCTQPLHQPGSVHCHVVVCLEEHIDRGGMLCRPLQEQQRFTREIRIVFWDLQRDDITTVKITFSVNCRQSDVLIDIGFALAIA